MFEDAGGTELKMNFRHLGTAVRVVASFAAMMCSFGRASKFAEPAHGRHDHWVTQHPNPNPCSDGNIRSNRIGPDPPERRDCKQSNRRFKW